MTSNGIDVEHLSGLLRAGRRFAALYTVPDFHNPSQGTLPTEQRVELVRLAEHYGFVVLADNPYRELRFRGAQESVEPFNASSHVFHVNTFTKTLGPGLRLGWVVVPEQFGPDVVALRARQDSHSSTFVQAVVAELLTGDAGLFDRVLGRARALYLERSDAFAEALEAEAPGVFDVTRPEGGLFLWPRLRDDAIDAARLSADARAEGVEYQRGEHFSSGGSIDSSRRLRLAFGDTEPAVLREAAVRLARAVRRQR